MKLSEYLMKAKAVIEQPQHWTKGTYARPKVVNLRDAASGSEDEVDLPRCRANANEAVCFCSLGALLKIDGVSIVGTSPLSSRIYDAKFKLTEAAQRVSGTIHTTIAGFNDLPSTTHERIMQVWDEAIESAKLEEA